MMLNDAAFAINALFSICGSHKSTSHWRSNQIDLSLINE